MCAPIYREKKDDIKISWEKPKTFYAYWARKTRDGIGRAGKATVEACGVCRMLIKFN